MVALKALLFFPFLKSHLCEVAVGSHVLMGGGYSPLQACPHASRQASRRVLVVKSVPGPLPAPEGVRGRFFQVALAVWVRRRQSAHRPGPTLRDWLFCPMPSMRGQLRFAPIRANAPIPQHGRRAGGIPECNYLITKITILNCYLL